MATSMREDVSIASEVLPKMMAVDVSVENPVEKRSARSQGATALQITIAKKEPRREEDERRRKASVLPQHSRESSPTLDETLSGAEVG